ncbi:MAG: VOC family protein [Gallionellaceae bacterium]
MKITALLHASFLTADLGRSRIFYETLLGFLPSPARPDMGYPGVWYEVGANQQIHLMQLSNPEAELQHPQGVHRKGRQIRFQPKAGRSLHRRGCTKGRQSTTQQAACGIDTRGLKPQQHTQHGGRDRHVALAVSDLEELMRRLAAAGVACTLSKSGRRALFCRDPDGNALEFIEIREGSE